jgi:two-component system cell cycle response regulator
MSEAVEDTHRFKGRPSDATRTAEVVLPPPRRAESPLAYLVSIHPPGPTLGLRYEVGPGQTLIGRGSDCDVSVADQSVSRRHARIEFRDDGRFRITDLGSTNGTYVNHTRTKEADLHDGDYLAVGGSLYRFLAGGNVEAGYHEEIHRLAITDPLTGLPNRRALLEGLERELARARRYDRPLSLVVFDVDGFRAVRGRLGHFGGDHTLRSLASALRPMVRQDEVLARSGGDEFALCLPEASAAHAAVFAERVARAVAALPMSFEGERYQVTVSAGAATTLDRVEITPAGLVARAEEHLQEAKARRAG